MHIDFDSPPLHLDNLFFGLDEDESCLDCGKYECDGRCTEWDPWVEPEEDEDWD